MLLTLVTLLHDRILGNSDSRMCRVEARLWVLQLGLASPAFAPSFR